MSYNERYSPWLNLQLFHKYYGTDNCPISLAPSRKTITTLRRFNILIVKETKNSWNLLKDGNLCENDLMEDEFCLEFEFCPQSPEYYYVTGVTNVDGTLCSMIEKNTPKTHQIIQLNLKSIDLNFTSIKIEIETLNKYYEYICIPKYHTSDTPIKLIEEHNQLVFGEPQPVSLPDIPFAYRFVTKDKIQLNKKNNFKMQLWEIKENGESLISSDIPNPEPHQYSIIDTHNAIVTYFYY